MLKKSLSFILAVVMMTGYLIGRPASAEEGSLASNHISTSSSLNDNTLSNGYVGFAVDPSNGRFTVGTVGGNPSMSSDDHQMMLYGHNIPWSSYTTVHVDGESHIYGDSGFASNPRFDGNSNYSEVRFGNIRIQQVISIVENSSTQRKDIVEIKYIATNTGSSDTSFGLRIMLDTMLGENDAAPFRIPGHGDLTTEKEFSGDNIPQYWQAFDSLSNPKVVSHGNFVSVPIKPSKVQFTNWRNVYDTPWDYQVSEGSSNGDSAVSIIWKRTLRAGAQEEYVSRYGLSELLQDLRPPLGLTIASGGSVLTNSANDGYLPYTITVYVQNVGTATANNVTCRIQLPDWLAFRDSKETGIIRLGSMRVGVVETIEKTVYVKKNISKDIRTQFQVSVSADSTLSKSLTKEVSIKALNTKLKTGSFKYAGYINGKEDSTAAYFYSDSYFDNDSEKYEPHLATMSLCLALSAFSSHNTGNWKDKTRNAKALLEDGIGFLDFEQNEAWNSKPSMHSLGAVAAYKNIGDSTVVALAVRGGGYEAEWGGNFVLGPSGNHQGFEIGTATAYNYLNSYVNKHKSKFKSELKVWIVGFSRGGAVANMTAGKLTDAGVCGGMTLPAKNIFAYTFEAPQGYVGFNGDRYKHIHNQVNSMDLVPYVAPSAMGFFRYNKNSNMILPTLGTKDFTAKVEAIQSRYKKVQEGIPPKGKKSNINYNPNPYAMKIDLGIDFSVDARLKKWEFLGFSGYYPYIDIDANPYWKSRDLHLPIDAMLTRNMNAVSSNISGGRVGYVRDIQNPLSNLMAFLMDHDHKIDWSSVMYEAFFENYAEGARKITGILLYPFSLREKR